jgi:hypothetical protein
MQPPFGDVAPPTAAAPTAAATTAAATAFAGVDLQLIDPRLQALLAPTLENLPAMQSFYVWLLQLQQQQQQQQQHELTDAEYEERDQQLWDQQQEEEEQQRALEEEARSNWPGGEMVPYQQCTENDAEDELDEWFPEHEKHKVCPHGINCKFKLVCTRVHTIEDGLIWRQMRNEGMDSMRKIFLATIKLGIIITPKHFATYAMLCKHGINCMYWRNGQQCPFLHTGEELIFFAMGRTPTLEGRQTLALEDFMPAANGASLQLEDVPPTPLPQLLPAAETALPAAEEELPAAEEEQPVVHQGCCSRNKNWLFSWIFGSK